MERNRKQFGLTLVEILIVIAIITILTGAVIGISGRLNKQGEIRDAEALIAILGTALEEYHDFENRFPESDVLLSSIENSEALYYELNSIPASRVILENLDRALIVDSDDVDTDPEPIGDVLRPTIAKTKAQ